MINVCFYVLAYLIMFIIEFSERIVMNSCKEHDTKHLWCTVSDCPRITLQRPSSITGKPMSDLW
jgi:hypothetical protein